MNIYSVYDKATKTYGTPWFQPTDQAALRGFTNEVNRPAESNVIYTNPEDFVLYKLGKFSPELGVLDVNENPELMAKAIALVKTDTKER